MSDRPTRYAPPSAGKLLTHILSTPQLLGAVRALPGPALARLIDRVGLEDSGELVALASTEQLRQVFDVDLWRSERPGEDERFDAERFALWLEVMLEGGEAIAVEKLTELPEELVTMALYKQVLVIDIDALGIEMSGRGPDDLVEKALESCLYQEVDEWRIISRRHEGWDATLAALLALDRDHHDLLRRLLERLCHMSTEYIEDNGGLFRVLSSAEMLETDVAADREDRRAREGYVAPSSAVSFLRLARAQSLEQIEEEGRDPVTRAYFRELEAPAPAARAGSRRSPSEPKRPEPDAGPLLEVLREAEVLPSTPPLALLESGQGAPAPTLFQRAMLELAEHSPEAHARRMAELGYLANVLVAGCSLAGRSFRPLEAALAVVATCNLGLAHLLARARAASPVSTLVVEGADKLFRLGWRLLGELSTETGRALRDALAQGRGNVEDEEVRRELQRLCASVEAALMAGRLGRLRNRLDVLEEVLDPEDVVALGALLDECPALAGSLRPPSADAQAPVHFVATEEELRAARKLLRRL